MAKLNAHERRTDDRTRGTLDENELFHRNEEIEKERKGGLKEVARCGLDSAKRGKRETIFRGSRKTEKDGLQNRKKGVDALWSERERGRRRKRSTRPRRNDERAGEPRVVRRERREKVEVCCAAVGTDCRE